MAKVDADLRILEHLAHLAEREIPEPRRYRPVDAWANCAARWSASLISQLRHATRNASPATLLAISTCSSRASIWTTSSMNVQEHIEGIRGDDLEAIDNADLDRKAIGARGVDAMLKMILIDGFFQADPHPGNVMCLPGNRIALIDFGMVGRLSPARRSQLVNLLAGFVHQDEEMMLEVLLDWRGNEAVNEARLAADLGELAVDYSDAQLKDLRIGTLLHRVSAILREHSIVLPVDLALLFKALITLEGFGRQYDPEFRLVARAEPFLNRACPSAISRWKRGDRAKRRSATSWGWSPRSRVTLPGWSRTRAMGACGSTSILNASTPSVIAYTMRSIARRSAS